MTLIETVQLLGNLGEFLAAIAVLATLGYLVVQIRQNTKMLSSSVYSSWVMTSSKTLEMLADHAESFGAIYDDPDRKLADLTSAERRLHSAMFVHTMNTYEASYLNYLDGAISKTMNESKCRNLIRMFRTTPLHRQSWTASAEELFDVRYVEYVEGMVLPKLGLTADDAEVRI